MHTRDAFGIMQIRLFNGHEIIMLLAWITTIVAHESKYEGEELVQIDTLDKVC